MRNEKEKTVRIYPSVVCLMMAVASSLEATETAFDPQLVMKQLQELRDNQQRLQQTIADQQKTIDALQKLMTGTVAKSQPPAGQGTAPPALTGAGPNGTPETAAAAVADTVRLKELEKKVDELTESSKKTFPSQFNPAIGLVGETIFSYDSNGNNTTANNRPGGFDVYQRSVEMNLSASVDPFALGYAVINGSADAQTGTANMDVEEVALVTTSLPWGLTATGGRFFAEFGREAYIHDHELPTVNRPLVLDRYIGGETRTDGYQMNWLLPTEHYWSLTAGVGDGMGDKLANPGVYREAGGLTYWAHAATFFTLTPDLTLETGLSVMTTPSETDRGGSITDPNGVSTATEKERRVGGVDVTLSYQPLQNNQFAGITWRTEALRSSSRFQFDPNGVPNSGDETTRFEDSFGLYSLLTAKLSRAWNVGFEFDYLQNPENHRYVTFSYSPFITWYPSHFQQLRLQYTHSDRAGSSLHGDDAIYLQWVWIIGSHSHGFTER